MNAPARSACLVAIALLATGPAPGAPPAAASERRGDAVRSLEVRLPGPAGVLAGTLTLPEDSSARPWPAAVTLTGSGAHLRDGNRTPEHPYRPFRQIADALAARGVATLRLDDRGVGASAGNAAAATAEDSRADTEAAVRYLRGRPDVDPHRIALVGHSYGGQIAPMVAAADPDIAAVVLMAGPGRTFRETMRYQNRYRIESDPTIPEARREAELAASMRRQAENVAASREAWRRSIQDLDPLPVARRMRMPVLVLHGTTDRAVHPDDAGRLADAIRGGGNERVDMQLFEGLNHHFQRDPVGARAGYDRLPTQDLAPEFLSALAEWLDRTLHRESSGASVRSSALGTREAGPIDPSRPRLEPEGGSP